MLVCRWVNRETERCRKREIEEDQRSINEIKERELISEFAEDEGNQTNLKLLNKLSFWFSHGVNGENLI